MHSQLLLDILNLAAENERTLSAEIRVALKNHLDRAGKE